MVVDSLENLEKYVSLNPLFPHIAEFLKSTDLRKIELKEFILKENDLIATVVQTTPKTKEEAKLETHRKYIDIHIPLSDIEIMGYAPEKDCLPANAPYDAEKDITFFGATVMDYITVKPGMFTIFFPQDGHAPAISSKGVKKIIIKIKA